MASTGDPAPNSRRSRRTAAQQREAILTAARTEFVAAGFAGTKMRDIATRADVNDALLYRYFDSKDHLFDEAVSRPLEEAVRNTFVPAPGEDDIRAVAERFMTELSTVMREIVPLLTVVLADAERGAAFYRERIEPALAHVSEATRANLGHWDHADFDPDLLVRIVWGVCWFIALDDRLGEKPPYAPEAAAVAVNDVIWDGLRRR